MRSKGKDLPAATGGKKCLRREEFCGFSFLFGSEEWFSWASGDLSVLAEVYPWDGGWFGKELLLEKKWHEAVHAWQEAGSSVVCVS